MEVSISKSCKQSIMAKEQQGAHSGQPKQKQSNFRLARAPAAHSLTRSEGKNLLSGKVLEDMRLPE